MPKPKHEHQVLCLYGKERTVEKFSTDVPQGNNWRIFNPEIMRPHILMRLNITHYMVIDIQFPEDAEAEPLN